MLLELPFVWNGNISLAYLSTPFQASFQTQPERKFGAGSLTSLNLNLLFAVNT